MKLTQSQLRKLIREELSGIVSEDSASDQMAVDKVREVVELWNESYNKLPDDESRALFEDFLNQNLKLYTERWQQERAAALNEITADQADRFEAALEVPGAVGTGRGIEVVKRHLGEIVGELVEGELDPQGPTRLDLDELAPQVHKMIMLHLEEIQ